MLIYFDAAWLQAITMMRGRERENILIFLKILEQLCFQPRPAREKGGEVEGEDPGVGGGDGGAEGGGEEWGEGEEGGRRRRRREA